MTKQEVIREHRETEGDPLIKSRIRSIAMSMARKRMLQDVPTADVVVVNPTHVAVALKYDMTVALAPVVVAMGQRKLAARIKQIALESHVPVIENKPVARALLATATVGQPIPPALYAVIAEILAFVYRQRADLPVGDLLAGKEVN
jgi:flagellar biosynthetic protein FlhB